jgi:predicted nucleotidyltransferase
MLVSTKEYLEVVMVVLDRITIPDDELARFCRRNHVRELALFGSVLRDDFRSGSDVDVLVEFEPDARITLFDLSRMQRELAQLIGRDVDLVPKAGLKPLIRDDVLASSKVIYGTRSTVPG